MNKLLKERNQTHSSFDSTTTFTQHLKGIAHVDTQYSEVYGEGLDTPMEARGNYRNDVVTVARYFKRLIPSPFEESTHQPFQGLAGVDISKGDWRLRKPWAFVKAVADGRSAPYGYNNPKSWEHHFQDYLDNNMCKK